jgi:adenylosuccinate lyase
MKELPFIASENIMMGLVKKGGDRQEIHEKIRVHSIAAGKRVKEEGLENDMIERICNDPTLDITIEEIKEILVPSKYIGRCVEQVENFLANDVDPLLAGVDGIKVDLAV